jgi:hypothetical protein
VRFLTRDDLGKLVKDIERRFPIENPE